MALKTYVLLESMDSDAPVYQTTADNKRVQIKKIRTHRPTLRQTFQDEKGVTTTIRYKANSNFILQDEQIEKEKIDANAPFSTREFRDPEFKFGVCLTNKETLQKYMEAHPEFIGFKGTCDDIREPRYRLLDEVADAKLKNTDIRLRVSAANRVLGLDLEAAQSMLIRLNGSFFTTPTDLLECQNLLMNFVDDAEEAGLNDVLKEDTSNTIDEQTSVLIGKLLNADLISFDATSGKISKRNKDNKWVIIRDMASEYTPEEKVRLLSDFLNSEDGKPLKNDFERLLNKAK